MNKIILIFAIIVSFFNAQAESLHPDTVVKYNISGQLVNVRPLCPPNAMCITDGTLIELKFEPADVCSKIDFKYEIDSKDRNLILVTATEERRLLTACATVMPEPHFESIALNMTFPPIKIVFQGTQDSIEIK